MSGPRTSWRLRAVAGLPRLELQLVVDTDAPGVVQAIESAAAAAGIRLERLELDDEADPRDRDEFGHGLGEVDGGCS